MQAELLNSVDLRNGLPEILNLKRNFEIFMKTSV